MKEFSEMTIKEFHQGLKEKKFSAQEAAEFYFKKIEEKNAELNAYLEVFDDALAAAEEVDKEISQGKELGMLSGVPLAIKDNILIEGKICSAASKMLENYRAVYDASVIKKLRAEGAVFLGRTNMDEFAMGSSTENSAFGPTKNPYNASRVPGGSSGGSAAAVAADMALGALGSDTGGSIRQPAGFCGVVGLKPTYGAVSRYGLIAMASSLDQIGPLAKSVEDAEIIFKAIAGRDEMDSTSVGLPSDNPSVEGKLNVGLLEYDKEGVDESVSEAMERAAKILEAAGHKIKKISLDSLRYSLACYYIIMPAEVSSNLARFDGIRYGLHREGEDFIGDYMETRSFGFGREVKRRIMLGTYVLSAGYYDEYYGRAQKVRDLIKSDFHNAFKDVDALLLPTSPTPAFAIGERTDDPLKMYLSDIFTVSANLAGLPAISLPAGKDEEGMPLAVQLMAPHFREDILFFLGKKIEESLR